MPSPNDDSNNIGLEEKISSPDFDEELFFIEDEESGKFSDMMDSGAKKKGTMPELSKTDLAEFFGNEGPLAHKLEGYELRQSQLEMAETIKNALLAKSHALIEAPTGTGKSIAYLVPAILSGKTVVVATANKSLQSQLYYKDIPFLRSVLNKPITAVVVKGRSNFVCSYKWDQEDFEQRRISFIDREHDQVTFMRKWLNETDTGDVDDLPFMLDSDIRPRVVSFPDDCLHTDCRHYHDNCWVNHMRDKATEAQVLITNHHLLLNALELGWAGERILPPAAIYIIDEAHQLEQTATAVFETTVTDYTLQQLLSRSVFKEHVDEDELDALRFHNTLAFQEASNLHRDNSFRIETELEEMKKLSRSLDNLVEQLKRKNPYGDQKGGSTESIYDEFREKESKERRGSQKSMTEMAGDVLAEQKRMYEMALETLSGTASKLLAVARSNRDDNYVRYAVRVFDRRHITIELHAAPINPATMLSDYLFQADLSDNSDEPKERTVICTSATLATKNDFQHFKQRCGLEETGSELVLPSVFDYPEQALLYQPPLPAYNWRNAEPYYNAIAGELERLLEVSRGRALCLFTSWSGLQQVRDRLITNSSGGTHQMLIWPIRAQGDAPRDALLDWFKETPYSVLLATKSFWEGVDIPGEDLSLVVLDKMPFPTPKDPLHSARMKTIDDEGRSSFGDYMLPLMTLTLKQGFGRLIRRSSDRGIVAILDERLTSKSYGRQAQQDLPPTRFTRNFRDAHQFFRTALDSQADFALNVWALSDASTTDDARNHSKHRNRDEFDDTLFLDDGGDVEGDIYYEDIHSDSSIRWRWQLLRLQDGKADSDEGIATEGTDIVTGELSAAIAGLSNLRQRIEKAGRSPSQFGVEMRCSHDTQDTIQTGTPNNPLCAEWQSEQSQWREICLVPVPKDNI